MEITCLPGIRAVANFVERHKVSREIKTKRRLVLEEIERIAEQSYRSFKYALYYRTLDEALEKFMEDGQRGLDRFLTDLNESMLGDAFVNGNTFKRDDVTAPAALIEMMNRHIETATPERDMKFAAIMTRLNERWGVQGRKGLTDLEAIPHAQKPNLDFAAQQLGFASNYFEQRGNDHLKDLMWSYSYKLDDLFYRLFTF